MLVSALLVRNEADRYLERVLTRCLEYSDEVIVLDDGSTDGSVELAEKLGCQVRQRTGQTMWGNESPARAELYDWSAEVAGDGWVIVNDADMVLHGDPRPLTLSTQLNSWAWPLCDLWNDEKFYRCDGFWVGHLHPRVWMYRPSALKDAPIWNQRGIHTGHLPQNYPLNAGIVDPLDGCDLDHESFVWLHYSFLRPEDRKRKLEQYMSQQHQLSPQEYAHALSVGD